MRAQIAPYSLLMFQPLGGGGVWDSVLTLCRLAVGGFSFIRGHAGPGLGLHVNAVHILENTGNFFFSLSFFK